jgi:hypothetical protein
MKYDNLTAYRRPTGNRRNDATTYDTYYIVSNTTEHDDDHEPNPKNSTRFHSRAQGPLLHVFDALA